MTSELYVKYENLKTKLKQIFIYWFQFCADVALFITIYYSVQIIYKHAV